MPNPFMLIDDIIVQCPRPDLETEQLSIEVYHNGLLLRFGTLDKLGFRCESHEFFHRAEYEEIYAIHDGQAWNVAELAAWVAGLEIVPVLSEPAPTATAGPDGLIFEEADA